MGKQQAQVVDPNRVEGIPSKELFISMLVKDLTLRDAIGDLVDNSVDAANKNAINRNDLSSFSINIALDRTRFQINDNAGGIEEDVARESAFKLGKPRNYKIGRHTIGQFGIGMKRAFFKIGEKISVESVAQGSSFKLTISVPEWRDKQNDNDWDFTLDSVAKVKAKRRLKDTYTKIHITSLKEETKRQFSNPQFLIDLTNEISLEHIFAISKGLNITINNDKLEAPRISLIYDKKFRPCYWKNEFPNGLQAEIVAGISEDKGEEGGWYVFCNERLILGPDTTEITGWKGGRGKGGKEGKELPKYHDQYFRFRGYVFFNADDSSKLPWTTSKTGIDKDSPEFLFVRVKMIELAKQVKKLMDELKTEREQDNPEDNRYLNKEVEAADTKSVKNVSEVMSHKRNLPSVFEYPSESFNPVNKQRNSGKRITFSKPTNQVREVMRYFSVDNANEAGSKTFDYFYDNQIGEE